MPLSGESSIFVTCPAEIAAATSLSGMGSSLGFDVKNRVPARIAPTRTNARVILPYLCFLKKSKIWDTDCFILPRCLLQTLSNLKFSPYYRVNRDRWLSVLLVCFIRNKNLLFWKEPIRLMLHSM